MIQNWLFPASICLVLGWFLTWCANYNPDPAYHPFPTWRWKLAYSAFLLFVWKSVDFLGY